jgi:protein required for attachment to host cells
MAYKYETRRLPIVWIVVADRASARIFKASPPTLDDLFELESLVHTEGALHGRDVYADAFGRNRAPNGRANPDEPETDFRHHTAEDFAAVVINRLEKGRNNQEFGRLIVVAPPLFLGVLRGHYSPPLQKLIDFELDKELVRVNRDELLSHVRVALESNGTGLCQ